MDELIIFTDGASKGNPGISGAGIAIYNDKKEKIKEFSQFLGTKTNNEAEYLAIIYAIELIKNLKAKKIKFFSDSQLLVKQLSGEYKVKTQTIKKIFDKINTKIEEYNLETSFHWIPRTENTVADSLANKAIENNNNSNNNVNSPIQTKEILRPQNISQNQQASKPKKNLVSKQNILLLDKSFFGQINCFKVQLNSDKEIYFHIGLLNKATNEWKWNKVKMAEVEIGQIIDLLLKEEGKCAFFHKYNNSQTQIWCNKSQRGFSIKIKEFSKNLSIGEAQILKICLEECIRKVLF